MKNPMASIAPEELARIVEQYPELDLGKLSRCLASATTDERLVYFHIRGSANDHPIALDLCAVVITPEMNSRIEEMMDTYRRRLAEAYVLANPDGPRLEGEQWQSAIVGELMMWWRDDPSRLDKAANAMATLLQQFHTGVAMLAVTFTMRGTVAHASNGILLQGQYQRPN